MNPSMIQGTTTVAGEARGFIVATRFHRGHLSIGGDERWVDRSLVHHLFFWYVFFDM